MRHSGSLGGAARFHHCMNTLSFRSALKIYKSKIAGTEHGEIDKPTRQGNIAEEDISQHGSHLHGALEGPESQENKRDEHDEQGQCYGGDPRIDDKDK